MNVKKKDRKIICKLIIKKAERKNLDNLWIISKTQLNNVNLDPNRMIKSFKTLTYLLYNKMTQLNK